MSKKIYIFKEKKRGNIDVETIDDNETMAVQISILIMNLVMLIK